jgi:hypothetical protein
MTSWDVLFDILLRLGVVLGAAYVLYELLLHRRADFVIRVRADRVDFKGNFPHGQRAAIVQFLVNDAAVRGPCRIYGARKKPRLSVWFSGRISDSEKQRVRNFLTIGP